MKLLKGVAVPKSQVDDRVIPILSSLNLSSLDLSETQVTAAGVAKLNLSKVMSLYLRGIELTDDSIGSVTKANPFLSSLVLDNSGVTDSAVAIIARNCPRLNSLHLRGARITDASVEPLSKLQALTTLLIYQTSLSENAVSQLKQALPKCSVLH